MKLLNWLFPNAAELAEATKRIDALEAERAELKKQNKSLWDSYNAHDATVQAQRTEIAALTTKLREQNDADMMLVSAKLIATIVRGEKPWASDVQRYHELSLALQQMQMSPYVGSSYASVTGTGDIGILGALGLGGVFGR